MSTRTRTAVVRLLAGAAAVGLVAACGTSSGTQAGPPAPGPSDAPRTGASAAPVMGAPAPAPASGPACDRGAGAETPASRAADAGTRDVDITSFDGTTIRAHWFPVDGSSAAQPAPTVLMGPGWSLPGDTDEGAVGVLGALNIATLRAAGFNVLTWDPRGFGRSGGTATVNSKDFEGRDVQVLLDWIASLPAVQLDRAGDPRVGMIGGSYGGGIQFIAAAIDCRVDAIVPVIAWHSLQSSLYKADTVKSGWSGILSGVTRSRPVDPHVASASASGQERGTLSAEDEAWFVNRGPGDLVDKVAVPTLIVQGTVDTLFTLDEAVTNYGILRTHDAPVSMFWFCGGHGTCFTNPGDPHRLDRVAVAWLQRYVKGDTSVETGPRFDFLDQNGTRYTADDYPLPAGAPVAAEGSGTLALTAGGGAGPATRPPGSAADLLSSLVLPVTPAKATNAVNVEVVNGTTPNMILGAPQVRATYTGTSPPGEKPTRVFAQLVDDETGLVVGNQVTPIAVTLDGQAHELTVPLEIVAFLARPGAHLTLQLVATTVAYGEPRLGGTITFSAVEVSLPVVTGFTPAR